MLSLSIPLLCALSVGQVSCLQLPCREQGLAAERCAHGLYERSAGYKKKKQTETSKSKFSHSLFVCESSCNKINGLGHALLWDMSEGTHGIRRDHFEMGMIFGIQLLHFRLKSFDTTVEDFDVVPRIHNSLRDCHATVFVFGRFVAVVVIFAVVRCDWDCWILFGTSQNHFPGKELLNVSLKYGSHRHKGYTESIYHSYVLQATNSRRSTKFAFGRVDCWICHKTFRFPKAPTEFCFNKIIKIWERIGSLPAPSTKARSTYPL